MIGLPAPFANTFMCLDRKDELIGFPEIAVTPTTFVCWWNLFPKFATGHFTPISDDKGYDLASAATYDRPNPAFVPFFVDKRPHFVSFQYIFGFGGQECVFKFWVGFVLFLAKKPASGDLRQRCARHRACWIVHGRQTKSVPFVPPCIHVSVPTHRVFRSLYTRIADCRSHCVHF